MYGHPKYPRYRDYRICKALELNRRKLFMEEVKTTSIFIMIICLLIAILLVNEPQKTNDEIMYLTNIDKLCSCDMHKVESERPAYRYVEY